LSVVPVDNTSGLSVVPVDNTSGLSVVPVDNTSGLSVVPVGTFEFWMFPVVSSNLFSFYCDSRLLLESDLSTLSV